MAVLSDKLVNVVANLGTERDKASHTMYACPMVTDLQLSNAYRGAWLPRKIVEIPALDSCRKWRCWQADKDQAGKIEAEEKRLNLRGKVLEALTKARLWGGAAIYIGTGDRDPSLPLTGAKVKKGGIKFLTVMTRRKLTATEIETDPESEFYGKPKAYTLVGGNIEIHPSRLVIFHGAARTDEDELQAGAHQGWGDSVLLAIMEAIGNSDSTAANIASLVFEAKVDVISIPDFMQSLQDPGYEKQVLERLRLAAMAKGINGTLILDTLEKYEQKSASFTNLTEILMAFLQIVSGAADIPMTRLLAQSPGGMNATGDSDTRNYYDRISAMQELTIEPAMQVLDECLIRSALGSRPAELHYTWNSLWQATAMERATIGKTIADTIKTLGDTKLIPEEALSHAAVSMLVENSVMPGLEAAIEEFGSELPDDDEADPAEAAAVVANDAAPRTLYVSRKVLNASALIAWAKEQGFESTLAADDLHVTIAFSKAPIDWMKVGDAWSGDRDGKMTVAPGGARLMERFGSNAVVLLFNSSELAWRHMAIREAGASWDWPEYQPHITISYAFAGDLSKVIPYRGPIEFGPEVFAEVDEDWNKKVKET